MLVLKTPISESKRAFWSEINLHYNYFFNTTTGKVSKLVAPHAKLGGFSLHLLRRALDPITFNSGLVTTLSDSVGFGQKKYVLHSTNYVGRVSEKSLFTS